MSPHELKALQVQLSKAQADEKAKKETLAAASRDHNAARERVAALERQIATATQEPHVTEHALLRYIERIYGVDLEEMRRQILTPTTVTAIRTLGSGKYPLSGGGKAVVKGMSVVSISD